MPCHNDTHVHTSHPPPLKQRHQITYEPRICAVGHDLLLPYSFWSIFRNCLSDSRWTSAVDAAPKSHKSTVHVIQFPHSKQSLRYSSVNSTSAGSNQHSNNKQKQRMDFYIRTKTVCKLCDFVSKLSPFLRKPLQGYAPAAMIFF